MDAVRATFGDRVEVTHAVGVHARAGRIAAGTKPAYPFGHGLGYATWAYQGIDAPTTVRAGHDVTVAVSLINTGRRPGKEVVQVYLSRARSSIERPAIWLAGFQVVRADGGSGVVALVDVAARAFQHWSAEAGQWRTEPGAFRLTAGRSVADQPLACDIEIPPKAATRAASGNV